MASQGVAGVVGPRHCIEMVSGSIWKVTSQAAINFVSNNAFLNGFFTYVPNILLILAVIITIISGVDYFVKNKAAISMK